MRIVVISDIHSNLEALSALLERIDKIKPDKVFCLGDIVGYGANPDECVDIAKKRVDISLCGNHEYVVLGYTDMKDFSENARLACEWTRKILSDENLAYIKALPLTVIDEGIFLVHSTPFNPVKWDYIFTQKDALVQFKGFSQSLCLVGHSHIPACFTPDGNCKLTEGNPVYLIEGEQYIINFGSVGQPRDYDPRASFGMIDTEKREVHLIRVSYNIEKAQRKIMDAGLPLFLAQRLNIGR
ncbi:metallophosphatase family protein [candidate division WOR-3 bacterium]|nr:metallophosphatase family protein [candidate division WOR-3 bacterium]